MTAAVGPANENYRETIIGTQSGGGQVATTTYVRGKDRLTTISRGPMLTMSGTFHGADWNRDANGITVADDPDPGLVPTGQKTTVQRVATPQDAYLLTTNDTRGFGTRDYIDPATFLVRRHDDIDATGTTTITYASYAKFGSQMLPVSWSVDDTLSKTSTTYVRTQFVLGGTTEDDVAVPPVHQFVTLPAGAQAVDLHAEFDGSRFSVPVTIGGKQLYFMVDSGASSITIDPTVASQLHLATFNPEINVGAHAVLAENTVIPLLEVSGIQMRDAVVTVIPMGSGHSATDPAGLLGFDFLSELALHVDFAQRRVIASDPRLFLAPPSTVASAIPIRLGDHIPIVTATIGGAPAERVVIDTGAAYSLVLFDYFTGQHKDVVRARYDNSIYSINVPDREMGEGVGGNYNARTTTINTVNLGPFTIRDTSATIVTSKDAFRWDTDGLFGADLLSVFTADFDYAAGRIFLTPNPSARKR